MHIGDLQHKLGDIPEEYVWGLGGGRILPKILLQHYGWRNVKASIAEWIQVQLFPDHGIGDGVHVNLRADVVVLGWCLVSVIRMHRGKPWSMSHCLRARAPSMAMARGGSRSVEGLVVRREREWVEGEERGEQEGFLL